MLFSILSAALGTLQQISRKMKIRYSSGSSNMYKDNYDGNNNNMYKMTINCDKFETHHIHIYNLIENILCYILKIDDTYTSIIEVFYITSTNHDIFIYLQLSSSKINVLFGSVNQQSLKSNLEKIGIETHETSEMLKQELIESLNLKVGKKRIQVNEPGKIPSFKLVSKMDVSIDTISVKMAQQINRLA